ncbi:MAG: flavodoxin domain-containing protein, partial [Prevotella sp.]
MIFYFSAEGDSQWVARKLAAATQDVLISIPEVMGSRKPFILKKGERMGFVFPVHGWRVPTIVRTFLSRLTVESAEKPFTYAVVTAGDNIGLTVDRYLNKAL